jgi:hypothetical protein
LHPTRKTDRATATAGLHFDERAQRSCSPPDDTQAVDRFGWPAPGIAARLRKHHSEIPKLNVHVQAIARIPLLGIQVPAVTPRYVEAATLISQKYELLTGDSLIVAVMQAQGLTNLASNDADFDRVSGLTRFAPV